MEKGAVSVIICTHLENLLIGPSMYYPSQKMAEMQQNLLSLPTPVLTLCRLHINLFLD